MNPAIEYVQSPEGLRLAFAASGDGPPLVIAATYPWSHIQAEYRMPEIRHYYERLAANRRLIRYDGRGTGLSARHVTDFALDSLVADLAAVVDQLELDRFDLMGFIASGPVAIRYAATHPSRVSRLVLWSTYAKASDYTQGSQVQATRALIPQDWELYTETISHTLLGWSEGEAARRYASYIREAASQESVQAFMASNVNFDVTADLKRVECPTLILHRRQIAWMGMEPATRLAAQIPRSRLRILEGSSVLPFLGASEEALDVIADFLDEAGGRPARQPANGLCGRVIAHYELLERIGAGGMGDLYRARDMKLQRIVAVKILRLTGDNRQGLRRFVQEAQTASRLNHPNICIIHEIGGLETDIPFIAMEYVEGETLAAILGRRRMTSSEILNVASQVANGLAEAHSNGVTHRDITPSNLMLTPRGAVKILDFGIARLQKAEAGSETVTVGFTRPGTIVGTGQYMSPEQTEGREIDHRSDIFSLGTVLYELATGVRPFAAPTFHEMLDRIRHAEPPPIDNPEVPDSLQKIVLRCLEKDPSRRFSALELVSALRTAADEARQTPQQTQTGRPVRGARRAPGKPGLRVIATALTLGVILTALAWIGSVSLYPNETPVARIERLAVLPFLNLSPESENEYFSDGVTEELITSLSRLSGLNVVARTSAFVFKGQSLDVREIGKRLGVDAILEGSVRKSGDQVRVNARLIRASDGNQIWSQQYDKNGALALSIEDEISQSLADSLKLELRRKAEPAGPASGAAFEAHTQYMRGRFYWAKRTPDALAKAIEYFQRSTERDPSYARAYVGLADAYALLGSYEYGAQPPAMAMLRARQAAEKALELNPELAEAHASLAQITYQFDWNWEKAEKGFKRAIQLDPAAATAHHWYSEFLSAMGRFDESLDEIDAAASADPLSLIIGTAKGRIHYFARDNNLAVRQYASVLEMDNAFAPAHTAFGFALAQQRRYGDAIREFRSSIDAVGRSPVLLGSLGYAYGLGAQPEQAMSILAEMHELPSAIYVGSIYKAAIHLGLRDRNSALDFLDKAYEERSGSLVFLNVEPAVDELRSDPRFVALLQRIGLRH